MNVLIDPGHAPGNVNGGRNGYKEYEGMWKLSNYLKDILVASGVGAALTRTEDRDAALETRGGMAGRFDLFISQHSNAFNGAVRGVECFHSIAYPNDKAVAAKLTAAVSSVMKNPDRGAKTREGNGGKDYYGVIRAAVAAGCPQVFLIENGFHDNEFDEAFLLLNDNLKRIALAQAQVILETLGIKKNAAEPVPLPAGPSPEHIVDILTGKVRIDSPDYWVNILKGNEQVNVKYLNTLFARLAGFNV